MHLLFARVSFSLNEARKWRVNHRYELSKRSLTIRQSYQCKEVISFKFGIFKCNHILLNIYIFQIPYFSNNVCNWNILSLIWFAFSPKPFSIGLGHPQKAIVLRGFLASLNATKSVSSIHEVKLERENGYFSAMRARCTRRVCAYACACACIYICLLYSLRFSFAG